MLDVIDADSDIFADMGDRNTQTGASRNQRQPVGFQFRQPGQRPVGKLVSSEIVYLAGQIAKFAVRIDQTGFLLSGFAITNKFHDISPEN